jgi:RHS repeat-associated protein
MSFLEETPMPLNRSARVVVLLVVFLSFGQLAYGQVPTGTPPYGSYGGDPEVINLADLNIHLDVPITHRAGRGSNFDYRLTYDSSVWTPTNSGASYFWNPSITWGWLTLTGTSGYIYYTATSNTCYGVTQFTYYVFSNFAYVDPSGTPHPFLGQLTTANYSGTIPNSNCPTVNSPFTLTNSASDGSGLTLVATSTTQSYWTFTGKVTTIQGTVIQPPIYANGYPSGGASTLTDRNGNQITVDASGHHTDTLGTTVLTAAGSGTPANPRTYTYVAPNGGNASFTVHYTAMNVKTNFGCSGISEYTGTNVNLVTDITLPDNSKYSFTYEATPGYSGYVTGRIATITVPTGGTINYTYAGGSSGHITCADGSASGLTRQTPDGTWTYTRAPGIGAAYTTTVTDPQGNQASIRFQGIYETQRQVYQGLTSGTLLATSNTCYNGSTSPCTSTAVVLPITQIAQVSIVPGTNNLQSKRVALYNAYGLTTEFDEYDFGSGAPPSTPLRKTLTSYASLGNGIVSMPASVTVKDGSNNVKAQTTLTYDQSTPVAPSGTTPQHVAVSGSRGNVTTIARLTQGSSTLNQTLTYYDTGMVQTFTDANGATNTYNYSNATATCGNAFPTSASEPLSLSKSFAWSCNGGVLTSLTDENSRVTTATYNDPYFWRPNAVSDPTLNSTTIAYATGGVAVTPYYYLNNNNSIVAVAHNFDGLGRPSFDQRYQSPAAQNFDTASYTYDSNGRPYSTSIPCSVGAGSNCPPATPKTTQTYDALNRPLLTTDSGGGTTSYSYPQNDVLVTIGPAPTGENSKRRQLEYDGLGRLTSVCEITSASGSGSCGQNSPQTGYWTKYTYDTIGNLTGVTQNAQGTAQTRSYSYDALSRLTAETNPESGTKTYVYDSDSTMCGNGAYTSQGNLVRTTDAVGNCVAQFYDLFHRVTDVGSPGACKRFRYDNTNGVLGSKPSGVVVNNVLGRLVEAETDTCAWPITQSSIITDEWFSHTARGEVSDLYEWTLHSGGYYHVSESYFANGVPSQMSSNISGLPTFTYGVDGEGRPNSTSASAGQNPVSSALYNVSGQPYQVNLGSGDSDAFGYDSNTGRMSQYQFNVNGQALVGTLTWNANSTLQKLVISDPFNSADSQTCNYAHDDLVRLASANCGAIWGQTFGYDAFGNLTKSVIPGSAGYSFQPTYSSSTNRISSLPGFTPTYDANGNVLNDSSHSYSWDAFGRPLTIGSIGLTYDALGRQVEQNQSGTYRSVVYTPTGEKLAVTLGQGTVQWGYIPLVGGGTAVYTNGTLSYYRHTDWLGSARLASTPSRTIYSTTAYAPFAEAYALSGVGDQAFTGQNQDSVVGLYDFPAREYNIQGRWASPDPAGLGAANLVAPQSWNRYAYVLNSPTHLVDPFGLDSTATNVTGPACRLPQNWSKCKNEPIGLTENPYAYMQFEFMMIGATQIVDHWEVMCGLPGGGCNEIAIYANYVPNISSAGVASSGPGSSGVGSLDLGAVQYQQYLGMRLVKGLTPTVCGGGAFLFAGLQKQKGNGQGFAGGLLEWDSKSGWSGHGLFELGSHGAGGGVITNPLDGLVFLPLGEGSVYGVPVEAGALATTSGAVGGYGEVGKGNVGGGVGVYASISSVLGCGGG